MVIVSLLIKVILAVKKVVLIKEKEVVLKIYVGNITNLYIYIYIYMHSTIFLSSIYIYMHSTNIYTHYVKMWSFNYVIFLINKCIILFFR